MAFGYCTYDGRCSDQSFALIGYRNGRKKSGISFLAFGGVGPHDPLFDGRIIHSKMEEDKNDFWILREKRT